MNGLVLMSTVSLLERTIHQSVSVQETDGDFPEKNVPWGATRSLIRGCVTSEFEGILTGRFEGIREAVRPYSIRPVAFYVWRVTVLRLFGWKCCF